MDHKYEDYLAYLASPDTLFLTIPTPVTRDLAFMVTLATFAIFPVVTGPRKRKYNGE
jgi:hypothetical protein